MPGRSGGGVNPFRFARTTKTQECFSLKVGVGRNQFSWCHKPGIIFLLFLFPHRHTAQIQTFQFRILKRSGQADEEKEDFSISIYFHHLPTKSSSYSTSQRQELYLFTVTEEKKNHLNSNNYQITKVKMSYSYPIGEDRGGNTAQRVLRSQKAGKVKGEKCVHTTCCTQRGPGH